MDGDTRQRMKPMSSEWRRYEINELLEGWDERARGRIEWRIFGQNVSVRLILGGNVAEERIVGQVGFNEATRRTKFIEAIIKLSEQFRRAGVYGISDIEPMIQHVAKPKKPHEPTHHAVIHPENALKWFQEKWRGATN